MLRKKTLKEPPKDHADIPPTVSPEDIHANNKLLTDTEIKQVQSVFDHQKKQSDNFVYLSKKKLGKKIKCSCIQANGELYAIYGGKKQDKHLAEGGYSVAKLAQNLKTGEWFVLKVQPRLTGLKGEKQQTEVQILKEVGLAIAEATVTSKNKGERHKILMHLVPGEHLAQLQKEGKINALSLSERMHLAAEIWSRLDELHSKHILHWDLHDGNIMVDLKNMRIGLIDFGASKKYEMTDSSLKQEFEKDKRTELQTVFNVVVDLLGFDPVFIQGKFNLAPKAEANFPNEETKKLLAERLLEIKTAINNPAATKESVPALYKNLQATMQTQKQIKTATKIDPDKDSASQVFREMAVSAAAVKKQLERPSPAPRKPAAPRKSVAPKPYTEEENKEQKKHTGPSIKIR